jgi:hypothetical protein
MKESDYPYISQVWFILNLHHINIKKMFIWTVGGFLLGRRCSIMQLQCE